LFTDQIENDVSELPSTSAVDQLSGVFIGLSSFLSTSGHILETFLKHFPKIFLRQTI